MTAMVLKYYCLQISSIPTKQWAIQIPWNNFLQQWRSKRSISNNFQATTEGSRILSISLLKTITQNFICSRILIPKYIIPSHAHHYIKNNMTHCIKFTYLILYPHWGITELDHPHYVLDATSTQVYNWKICKRRQQLEK